MSVTTTANKLAERAGARPAPMFSKAALALLPANATVRAGALDEVSHAMSYR